MKKWQLLTLSVVLCLVMVVATACGGGETTTAPAGGDTTAPTGDTTAPTGDTTYEPVTWRLAHVVAETGGIHLGAEILRDKLAEETNGAFVLELYPNAQLGNNREMLESQQLGMVELNVTNVSLLSGYSPKTAAFELPYVIKSEEALAAVYDTDVIKEAIDPLQDAGLIWIGSWNQGWRHVTNNKREITSPADMSGLKIRTMDSQLHMDHFNTLGASAVPMAFSEVFTGLQQGAIDGQENPYYNIVSQGMHEVQNYITETGHICDITPLIMSKIAYEKLDPASQELVTRLGTDLAADERALSLKADNDSKQKVVDGYPDVKITVLTADQRAAFRAAAQPVYDKWSETITQDFMDKIEAAQAGF